MQRFTRLLAAGALVSSLAACVVQQPAPAPGPTPHEVALQRMRQVEGRLNNLSHRVDAHVNQGYYPPPQGAALHRQLDGIRGEAGNMGSQRAGGLSAEEARVLNQQMDQTAHAIGE